MVARTFKMNLVLVVLYACAKKRRIALAFISYKIIIMQIRICIMHVL